VTRKTFVIDTNVLLHDPEAMVKFPKNDVVIPVSVLEELDQMKRSPAELGKNARMAIRLLDKLKDLGKGDLHEGISIDNGARIRIELDVKPSTSSGFPLIFDGGNRTLAAAFHLKEKGGVVVLVSKDFASRIKAEAIGLAAEDYENLKFAYASLYRGMRALEVTKPDVDLFYKNGYVVLENLDCRPNEYCVMTSPERSSAVGKYDPVNKRIAPLIQQERIWGIRPLNVEQRCAVDLLLRDDIKLITLIGPAGTGKTLLALACGLRKVFDDGVYHRILISRPIMPLGRDIGYLPGTKEEKLYHWMQPIYDNLRFLCETSSGDAAMGESEALRWVMDSKKIEMEAVTYIRGRTLPKVFIIIDEAQNLTPHEVKTIISRAGEGTKVILTGDPTQIDNPYLDENSNALTYTVGKFSEHKIFGHMFMEKTERSELAAVAADIL